MLKLIRWTWKLLMVSGKTLSFLFLFPRFLYRAQHFSFRFKLPDGYSVEKTLGFYLESLQEETCHSLDHLDSEQLSHADSFPCFKYTLPFVLLRRRHELLDPFLGGGGGMAVLRSPVAPSLLLLERDANSAHL